MGLSSWLGWIDATVHEAVSQSIGVRTSPLILGSAPYRRRSPKHIICRWQVQSITHSTHPAYLYMLLSARCVLRRDAARSLWISAVCSKCITYIRKVYIVEHHRTVAYPDEYVLDSTACSPCSALVCCSTIYHLRSSSCLHVTWCRLKWVDSTHSSLEISLRIV